MNTGVVLRLCPFCKIHRKDREMIGYPCLRTASLSPLLTLLAAAAFTTPVAGQCCRGKENVLTPPGTCCEKPVARDCDAEKAACNDRLSSLTNRYEWRASTFTTSSQAQSALALLPDDSLVVCWSSRRQQEGKYGVYAQRFDSRGVAIGNETPLGIWNKSHQYAPAVAADNAGHIWAAWCSHEQDGDMGAIIARQYNDKLQGGSEILVNQHSKGHQDKPVIVIDDRNRALVAWLSVPAPHQPAEVRGRLFDSSGKPLTDEFTIAAPERGTIMSPAVAAGPDGTFAAVFTTFDPGMKPAGVRLQLFNDRGNALSGLLPVSSDDQTPGIEPVIASRADGYIVAWLQTDNNGDDYGVVARLFNTDGSPAGKPFIVNDRKEGTQNAPAIAVASDDTFTIAYNSADADDIGIFARCFTADGTPAGESRRLNQTTKGRQGMNPASATTRLAFNSEGDLLCAWDGNADKGDTSAANITMLTKNRLDLAGLVQGVTDDMPAALAHDNVNIDDADENSARPHVPPTFDRRRISSAYREVKRTARGIGFTGVVNTGWNPPDPHMAVGPNHIVVMTNGEIAFYLKDGTQTFSDEIEDSFGFWGSVGATGFVFDPEVLYDELSGRFFAMAAEGYAPGNRSYVLIAVSDDSDPNGTWYKYRFETTSFAGDVFDSPNISVDQNVLYVTGDGFGFGANYPVYTFDKASLLNGDPPAVTRSTTLSTSTQSAGIPPVCFDNPPALYMIEHRESFSNNTMVRLIALTDPLGNITFTTYNLTVPAYGSPGDPVQQGTSSRPETFDARFWSCAYRNGSLWATHHVDSQVKVRWYEINMNGWPTSGNNPQLVQSGTVGGNGIYTTFSSITADSHGNAALCFARSASDEYLSMATTYRLATDAPGTMRPMVIQKSSNGPMNGGRWGDYSSVQVDPATGQFWAHHEYAVSGSWRTWVTTLDVPNGIVNPDSFNIIRGSLLGGDVTDLYLSDDQYLQIRNGLTFDASEAPVWLQLDAVSPTTTPAGMQFTLEAHVSSPGVITQFIELYNYQAGAYEQVDARLVTTADAATTVDVTGDPARFVNPDTGAMNAQLRWKPTGLTMGNTWIISIDQSVWNIQ